MSYSECEEIGFHVSVPYLHVVIDVLGLPKSSYHRKRTRASVLAARKVKLKKTKLRIYGWR
jgi:hypothetical protein